MLTALSNSLSRIRQPEYTGANRCTPCTILNLVIAGVLAGAVGVTVDSITAGLVVFTGAGLVIYLRGYLVPGTPTFTSKYFPDRVLRWFDKEPTVDGAIGTEEEDPSPEVEHDDIATLLHQSGVVEDCPDGDDLCLTESFSEAWWRRISQFRDDRSALDHLATVLEVDPEELAVDDGADTNRFDITFEGDRIGGWDSRAAFLADLAAEPTLAEWIDDWEALDDRVRTRTIASLRAFLERCPDCEGALTPVENTVKSCCSSSIVTVEVDCRDCGARVFDGSYR